jgi:hypothetical protein
MEQFYWLLLGGNGNKAPKIPGKICSYAQLSKQISRRMTYRKSAGAKTKTRIGTKLDAGFCIF